MRALADGGSGGNGSSNTLIDARDQWLESTAAGGHRSLHPALPLLCMPAEGIPLVECKHLLTLEELGRLCALLRPHGLRKIRITGGEPLVRRGILSWLATLSDLRGPPEL